MVFCFLCLYDIGLIGVSQGDLSRHIGVTAPHRGEGLGQGTQL